jgi:hypothetical protein
MPRPVIVNEGFQDELAPRDNLKRVICGDIGREELGLTGLLLRTSHRVRNQRNRFLKRGVALIALRLVILDEIPTKPKIKTGISEGARP